MRIFPAELEERAFRHDRLQEWRDARLVGAEEAAALAAEIGERPARAAWPLRVVLFGFSALCLTAAVILVAKDFHEPSSSGLILLIFAGLATAGAEFLIRSLKLYRQGVEEALVAGATILFAVGALRLSGVDERHFSAAVFAAALAAAAALAYARYGYRLAAIGVACSLGVLIGSWDMGENATRVGLAALYALLLAAVTWWPDLPRRERERLEIARFFLALSIPLCLNLGFDGLFGRYYGSAPREFTPFVWFTLAAIFVIPAGIFAWGILDRRRALFWAGALGLLVAACSVKPYFGWARHSWDPAVLGAELFVLAVVLKRWLDAGPGGRRGAYSSEDLDGSRPGGALGVLAGALAAAPAHAQSPAGPQAPRGGGGDFGGGGASGSF